MELAIVGSGSKGNCSLVRSTQTLLMIDCGFSLSETEKRLKLLDVLPEEISAVLVTHEHSDHITGVARLVNKYNIPVYLTHGTQQYFDRKSLKIKAPMFELSLAQAFTVGDVSVTPVPVPHDAKEPCQFVFECGGKKLGVLSDLGHISPAVNTAYSDCDLLFIECNHDRTMLAEGPYPAALKERVLGHWGHLSNCQTVRFLAGLKPAVLQQLVIGHISEVNNATTLVTEALAAIESVGHVHLASQRTVQPWVSIA